MVILNKLVVVVVAVVIAYWGGSGSEKNWNIQFYCHENADVLFLS